MENEPISFLEKAKPALQHNLRWGGMLVVIGYVMVGLMVLLGLGSAFIFSQTSGIAALFILLVYAIVVMMYFFPLRKLNAYLQGCRDALQTDNEQYFIDGLKDLAGSMRLMVIYFLVAIGLYAILFLGALLLGSYSTLFAT
jgi:hypothetical protein